MQENILLITVDQLNPDYLTCTGGKARTPNIDRLAESLNCRNAVTPSPVCMPARCGLLTGKYPHQVGALSMSGALNLFYPTFPRALQEHGWQTGAFGKLHFMQDFDWSTPEGKGYNLCELNEQVKQYGFEQLWEVSGKEKLFWDYCEYAKYLDERGLMQGYRDEFRRRRQLGHPQEPLPCESFGISEEDNAEYQIAEHTISFLKHRDASRPFFAWCSFLSPHTMVDPPQRLLDDEPLLEEEEFIVKVGQEPLSEEMKRRWRENRRGYRALVRFVDEQVGRIVQTLKDENLFDNTVIMFASDHGDVLGSFKMNGKMIPWRESANVPLLIRHPRYLEGRSVDSPVSLIDVAATILDIAGLDSQRELQLVWPAFNNVVPCRSLMPMVTGQTDQIREYAFSEFDNFEMIQSESYKYIRWRTRYNGDYEPPREELYDLKADPNETDNIIANPSYAQALQWCRDRRDYVINSTPTGQCGWGKVGDMRFTRIRDRDDVEPFAEHLAK